MDKVLTISIAAYNIERFMDETLKSFIIPEIADKIEVVIVNDGSKDNTSIKAHSYAKQYPDLFVVIDKPNGGYGSTINASSRAARGKYFKTIDGDDWVDQNGIVKLVKYLSTCDDDIVITNFQRVHDLTRKTTPTVFSCSKYETSLVFDSEYSDQLLFMQAISIKTEILKRLELSITEHCFYTDIEYILTPVPQINTISFLNTFVYMYRIAVNEQSMSVEGKRKHIDEQLLVLKKMTMYYKNLRSSLGRGKQRYFITILSEMYKSHVTAILSLTISKLAKQRLTDIESYMRETVPDIYSETNRYRTIRVLRNTNYLAYAPGSLAYKAYQRVLKLLRR